jgi:uncharacterized protein YecE (DUF72 family)
VVGTSSWADPGFVEEWYPPGLPAQERLPWYAERFSGVEVNSSFYAIPARATVARWAQATPNGFSFDVKLHRLLSRHAASADSLPPSLRGRATVGARGRVVLTPALEAELASATLDAVEPLAAAGKLSCLLVQCSPAFSPHEHSLQELDSLIAALDPHPVAVEVRHRSWVAPKRVEATLGWMADRQAVWVGVDAPSGASVTMMPALDAVTRPGLAYLRAHGRNAEGYVKGRSVAERFGWRYSDEELAEIVGRARALAEEAGDAGQVRLMFNNNRGADAPLAAARAKELLAAGSSSG